MKSANGGLKDSLISIGLPDKEAAVYVALLELGRSTVSKIAREAQVNRATGYVVLDSLIGKGLARISGKEPKQEYEAESPDNLATLFNRAAEEVHANAAKAAALTLQLKSIQKVEDRPRIKFYEGVDGLKQVYEDTLTSTETIVAYASVDDMHAALPNYFPAYYTRRAKKGISIRGILPKTAVSTERVAHNVDEARESVLIPSENFGFHPEIDIYDNKVMIASWREKLGIIIESREIADAMKKIFELAWLGAKQLEKDVAHAPTISSG